MNYLVKRLRKRVRPIVILAALISGLAWLTQQTDLKSTARPLPNKELSTVTQAGPIVIDFENLSSSGPGQGGQTIVFHQYADKGIIFNSPAALDYSKGVAISDFAHSGTKAIEQCYGKEFCTTPIEMSFTAAQRRVKVWVGCSDRLNETRTVILRALDARGVQVGQATTILNRSGSPQPIRNPLEVISQSVNITRALVSFSSETILMNGLAVDDIEFDTAGPPPLCQSTRNPTITLNQPANRLTVEDNEFILQGTISTEALLEAATVTATAPGGSRSLDLLSSGLVSQRGGAFGPVRIDALLFPGVNTITATVRDCRGTGQSSVVITFAPEEERWVSVGPFGIPLSNNDVISGQVNAIAVHPRDANILYIGASEGGVWKTSNGGATWTPLSDFQLVRQLPSGARRGTLSIGSLAIDPGRPEILYAGTGDPNIADGMFGDGLGVFRSSDGGIHWTPMGIDLSRTDCENSAMSQTVVNKIIVRPGSPTTVFAATNSGLFKYKEDGSDCWKRLNNGLPMSGNAIDLVIDPFRATLYAAFWSQGIYKTTDAGGEQWRQLTSGLPASTSGFGRIALAFGGRTGVGFSTPQQLLYAGFDPGGAANGRYRLFKTTNGEDWSELPSPPSDGQLDFNNTIAVGLFDPNEVYIGQIAVWRATDGGNTGGLNNYGQNPQITGKSWTNVSCCLVDSNPFRRGLDLHADIHDIVFAPAGSFIPSPSQLQVLYITSDGGVTKGIINSLGVITWESLTRGLAIGQCGTLSLSPSDPDEVSCGLWHNGTVLMVTGPPESVLVGGGDGFHAQIDAGTPTTVYFNCNAGFGGALCRNSSAPHTLSVGNAEVIWSDNTVEAGGPRSDPYRPGHLLRIQRGKLVRNQAANMQAASALDVLSAWEIIDPPGKSGNTKTVAFARRRAFDSPIIYYIGTDTGQIWRGSPENGWVKLCDCGGKVDGISVDLTLQDRIVAIFGDLNSPGRIRELDTFPDGVWKIRNMDANFSLELQVNDLHAIAIDPLDSSKVFVATDQGIYRGRKENGQWVWTRSPGIPNLHVGDLQVHQSFTFTGLTGVVRASTFGRGIFELRRTASTALPFTIRATSPVTLSVRAIQIGEDGAPPSLSVTIPVTTSAAISAQKTPFELRFLKDSVANLKAPDEIRYGNQILKFVGWAFSGERAEAQTTFSFALNKNTEAIAYYERKARLLDPMAGPPLLSVSAGAKQVCAQSFSHELSLSWEASGGQPPITVLSEITKPNGQVETVGLKPLKGSRTFPLNFPAGGDVQIKAIATDARNSSYSAQASVQLKACR